VQVSSLSEIDAVASQHPSQREINWHLGSGLVLAHKFFVPVGALRDINKVVGLEVERIMPLPHDQLVYSYMMSRIPSRGGAVVRLYTARRVVTDAIFFASEKYGLQVRSICPNSKDDENQIDFKFRPLQIRSVTRSVIIFALLIGFMFSISLMPRVYKSRLESEIAEIDASVSQTRRQTEAIAGLQRQMQVMQTLYQSVQREQEQTKVVNLLSKLTEISPDDVVFEDFRLDGNRVYIKGIAVAPENWVLDLEKAEAFENVSLSSVIGLDDLLSKRFEVRFDVVSMNDRTG
jgi:hypothetical protein